MLMLFGACLNEIVSSAHAQIANWRPLGQLMQFRILLGISALLFALASAALPATAQDAVIRRAPDGVNLVADYYPAADGAPLILLLHMLNSQRSAYAPLIPDLRAAGYALLNIDMRGHGDSGGPQNWDAAIADLRGWSEWLFDKGYLGEDGLAIIGASIGANVAIVSCAADANCRGAIALSPGLDYRGVKPETALVRGLANRSALLVAAQADQVSAAAVRHLFAQARGDVTARLYPVRAHGTRLFQNEYASLSRLILGWLAQHLPVRLAAPQIDECDLSHYTFGKRGYILCSSIPVAMKPITRQHCLYRYMDDRDNDGAVCESDRS